MPQFFVVTGLPASGKTTVGSAVAAGLQLPLIDKDAILKSMFDAAASERIDPAEQTSYAWGLKS